MFNILCGTLLLTSVIVSRSQDITISVDGGDGCKRFKGTKYCELFDRITNKPMPVPVGCTPPGGTRVPGILPCATRKTRYMRCKPDPVGSTTPDCMPLGGQFFRWSAFMQEPLDSKCLTAGKKLDTRKAQSPLVAPLSKWVRPAVFVVEWAENSNIPDLLWNGHKAFKVEQGGNSPKWYFKLYNPKKDAVVEFHYHDKSGKDIPFPVKKCTTATPATPTSTSKDKFMEVLLLQMLLQTSSRPQSIARYPYGHLYSDIPAFGYGRPW